VSCRWPADLALRAAYSGLKNRCRCGRRSLGRASWSRYLPRKDTRCFSAGARLFAALPKPQPTILPHQRGSSSEPGSQRSGHLPVRHTLSRCAVCSTDDDCCTFRRAGGPPGAGGQTRRRRGNGATAIGEFVGTRPNSFPPFLHPNDNLTGSTHRIIKAFFVPMSATLVTAGLPISSLSKDLKNVLRLKKACRRPNTVC
jgi:hypothetical protein